MASFEYKGFTRNQRTLRGPDPTVVVEYVGPTGALVFEFQGDVYASHDGQRLDALMPLAAAFYKEAEAAYEKFLDEQFNDEGAYVEVEAAERAAAYEGCPTNGRSDWDGSE